MVIRHPVVFALTAIVASLLFVAFMYVFYFAVLHPIPGFD